MALRNARSDKSAHSPRDPQSPRAARASRSAQAAHSASRDEAARFSRRAVEERLGSNSAEHRAAWTAEGQDPAANGAHPRQTAARQYSRSNPNYSHAAAKRSGRNKRILIGVLSAVLVAVIGCGTAFAVYIGSINDKLNRGDKSADALSAIYDVLSPKKDFNEPFYMMLIGSDRRVGDDSAGARSDTNIVVRVDPRNNQATMLSIPRDTMIDLDGYGVNKFNAAYNYGDAAAVIKEAGQLCGVEISHYAEVNFDELVALVDAVGGVDVEVDERIDDTDADNSWSGSERIIIEEGMQHLDGRAALVFARSRAFVDGDFTRTANQRKLISALVDKVLSLPVTELPGVISAAADCVTTDLSVTDIIALAQQFKDGGDLTIYSAMVPTTMVPYLVDGISYVVTDTAALSEMMRVVEDGGDPSDITASPDAYLTELPKFGYGTSGYSSGGTGSYGGSSTYDYSYGYSSGGSYDGAYGNAGYYDPGAAAGTGTGSDASAGSAAGTGAGAPSEGASAGNAGAGTMPY